MKTRPKRRTKRAPILRVVQRPEDDPQYQSRAREFEKFTAAAHAEFREAAAPMLKELAAAGYEVSSLNMLAQSRSCEGAIPILVKWLPKLPDRRVKTSIVGVLSVPWAKGKAEAALLAEFRATADSENLGLKWAIGSALEVLASDEIFEDIVELVEDKRHGRAREMLAMALGKMKNPRAVPVLISLLDDDEVAGHALIGLRKLNAIEARPYIVRFLKHPKSWIRQEAKKALNKIDDLD